MTGYPDDYRPICLYLPDESTEVGVLSSSKSSGCSSRAEIPDDVTAKPGRERAVLRDHVTRRAAAAILQLYTALLHCNIHG